MKNTPKSSPAQELAAATSALVQPYEITDILAGLLQSCLAAVGARDTALLVVDGPGQLQLLSSTSHAASRIEVYQAQSDEGPCIECVSSSSPVSAYGEGALVSRWAAVGQAMVGSGYRGVHAQPLLWHGRALGGLNLFFDHADPLSDDGCSLAQAFADITTLALVQTQQPSDRELTAHISEALEGRTLIEQAKGVLMQTRDLEPGKAYSSLRSEAAAQGLTVTEMARSLVWQAHTD